MFWTENNLLECYAKKKKNTMRTVLSLSSTTNKLLETWYYELRPQIYKRPPEALTFGGFVFDFYMITYIISDLQL